MYNRLLHDLFTNIDGMVIITSDKGHLGCLRFRNYGRRSEYDRHQRVKVGRVRCHTYDRRNTAIGQLANALDPMERAGHEQQPHHAAGQQPGLSIRIDGLEKDIGK